MICKPCRDAADGIAQATTGAEAAEAAKGHEACTNCDCQHLWEKQIHGSVKG